MDDELKLSNMLETLQSDLESRRLLFLCLLPADALSQICEIGRYVKLNLAGYI